MLKVCLVLKEADVLFVEAERLCVGGVVNVKLCPRQRGSEIALLGIDMRSQC